VKTRPRILAIDFGGKFIGLAVSDPLGVTVRGLPTLKRSNKRADLQRIRELVEALRLSASSSATAAPARARRRPAPKRALRRLAGGNWSCRWSSTTNG
jgi:RNase H-fold protein (predicted Holliday junction resolvase)